MSRLSVEAHTLTCISPLGTLTLYSPISLPKSTVSSQMTDSCFEYFKYVPIKTTWNILYARIFNLEFTDFLRMVRDTYGATLGGKEGGYIYFYFTCQLKFCKKCKSVFSIYMIEILW